MSEHRVIRTYLGGAAVAKRRILKFGSADGAVVQASATADLLIGVSTELDSDSGAPRDVVMFGETDVEYGGAVPRGSFITADANGKAVVCSPAAGAKGQSIGKALFTAADGDIGPAFIFPSQVTTPV
ncbi:hypothetical protein sos41_31350 [Alphaproteobacteria bacterium SO-S41]|nr:hypothetical protein sos41_31350 [Alphaproteobacteria bacterium SO-S41]